MAEEGLLESPMVAEVDAVQHVTVEVVVAELMMAAVQVVSVAVDAAEAEMPVAVGTAEDTTSSLADEVAALEGELGGVHMAQNEVEDQAGSEEDFDTASEGDGEPMDMGEDLEQGWDAAIFGDLVFE